MEKEFIVRIGVSNVIVVELCVCILIVLFACRNELLPLVELIAHVGVERQ